MKQSIDKYIEKINSKHQDILHAFDYIKIILVYFFQFMIVTETVSLKKKYMQY